MAHFVEVAEMVLSRNKLDSMHWSQRSKYSKKWEGLLIIAFRFKPPRATGKVRLKITSHRAKFLDHDNLVGGCKGIIDALKRMGVILDDTPALIEVEYEQKKVKKADAKTSFEIF